MAFCRNDVFNRAKNEIYFEQPLDSDFLLYVQEITDDSRKCLRHVSLNGSLTTKSFQRFHRWRHFGKLVIVALSGLSPKRNTSIVLGIRFRCDWFLNQIIYFFICAPHSAPSLNWNYCESLRHQAITSFHYAPVCNSCLHRKIRMSTLVLFYTNAPKLPDLIIIQTSQRYGNEPYSRRISSL